MESFQYFCTKTSVALQGGVSHFKLYKSTVALFQPYEFTFYKASAQQHQKFDSLWISKDGAGGLSRSRVSQHSSLCHSAIPHESSEKERNKLRAIYIETEIVCNTEICPMINGCNCLPRNAEKIPLGNRGQCSIPSSEIVLHPEKINYTWCSALQACEICVILLAHDDDSFWIYSSCIKWTQSLFHFVTVINCKDLTPLCGGG